MDKLLDLLNSLELYEDSAKTLDLAKQINSLFNNIKFPYIDIENMPEIFKGNCTTCDEGILLLDVDISFTIEADNRTVIVDISICNKCNHHKIEVRVSGEI